MGLSRSAFLSSRPELVLLAFSFVSIFFIFLIAHFLELFKEAGKEMFPSKTSQNFIVESVKILGGAVFTGVVALLVTNVWQQKSVGFEMLKELNSPEFFQVRNVLSTQKKIAEAQGIDLDNIKLWFPIPVSKLSNTDPTIRREIKYYTKDQFSQAHALPSMIYFIVRLANYGKHGMLNTRVTRNLFNVFFVHYQVVILEFASIFERHYENYYINDPLSITELEIGMWEQRVKDIRYFYCMIGLDDNLPRGHSYKYFPSMNGSLSAEKVGQFATEVNISDYIKDDSIDNKHGTSNPNNGKDHQSSTLHSSSN